MRVTEQQDKELQEIGYTGDVAMDIDKAIRWMRDVKGVHVYADTSQRYWAYTLQWVETGYNMAQSCYIHDTHDLSQSAGLDAAIEYVKKQQL